MCYTKVWNTEKGMKIKTETQFFDETLQSILGSKLTISKEKNYTFFPMGNIPDRQIVDAWKNNVVCAYTDIN